MGGKALKHLNPVRLQSHHMLALWFLISERCAALGIEAHLVPWLLCKQDHGDMDILISSAVEAEKETALLESLGVQHADPLHSIKNGPVRSVAVPSVFGIVQVDLIRTPPESMAFSRIYFSNGGLGMFAGRVARALGLILASDGLYAAPDPARSWESAVFLTDDPRQAFEFIGFDLLSKPFMQCEREMFCWLVSGRYSSLWMFLPHGTNAENRSRDKTRPAMQRFQDYIIERHGADHPRPHPDNLRLSKEAIILLAQDTFGVRVSQKFGEQKNAWDEKKARSYATGLGALLEVAPSLDPEKAGPLIREMRERLPPSRQQELHAGLVLEAARDAARNVLAAHAHDIGEYK